MPKLLIVGIALVLLLGLRGQALGTTQSSAGSFCVYLPFARREPTSAAIMSLHTHTGR
jgi:hypothetical protein